VAVKPNTAGLVTPSKVATTTKTATPAVIAKPVVATRPAAESYVAKPGSSTTKVAPTTSTTFVAPTQTPVKKIVALPGFVPLIPGDSGDVGGGQVPPPVVAGRTVVRTSQNADGTTTIFYSDGTSEIVGTPTKKETVSNPAYATISKILESYGITDLASVLEQIRLEYPEASSDDIVTLLQFDDRYNAKFNQRFSANLERQKAGMSVLSPADYLAMEQGYKSTLSAYGLTNFNTQAYYNKFIANALKVTDIADRVSLAFDRVMNDEMVSNTFKKFYPSLTTVDIVSAMLDPVNQFPALERKVRAAEIGGAALRQGIIATELGSMETNVGSAYTNVNRGTVGADVLGQMGVTKAEAEKGYKTIAELLPTAEKLSSIYGGTEDQYGLLQAEQENLQGLASAKRKRERLTAIEMAQFGKKSGLAQGALSSQTNI
jgi:hypothetical protein